MTLGVKMTKCLIGICGSVLVAAVIVGCGGSSSGSADTGCLGDTEGSGIGSVGAESVTVSGVIEIESQTRVDSDTADDLRLNQATSNNCDDEAQSLPVTGVSGGYLSPVSGATLFDRARTSSSLLKRTTKITTPQISNLVIGCPCRFSATREWRPPAPYADL